MSGGFRREGFYCAANSAQSAIFCGPYAGGAVAPMPLRKRGASRTEPVVSGASSFAAILATSVTGTAEQRSRSSDSSRVQSELGSVASSGGGGTKLGFNSAHVGSVGNVVLHHEPHRRKVRRGTPVAFVACRSAAVSCAKTLARRTTTSRYTRRPRNRNEGGNTRLRHPWRPQHNEWRTVHPSAAAASKR